VIVNLLVSDMSRLVTWVTVVIVGFELSGRNALTTKFLWLCADQRATIVDGELSNVDSSSEPCNRSFGITLPANICIL
jgi:hypothetical protein